MCYSLSPHALIFNKKVLGFMNNPRIVLVGFPFDSPTHKATESLLSNRVICKALKEGPNLKVELNFLNFFLPSQKL